jgi:hypothetical protein
MRLGGSGEDDVWLQFNHVFSDGGQPLLKAVGKSIAHVVVIAIFGIAELSHAAQKTLDKGGVWRGGGSNPGDG